MEEQQKDGIAVFVEQLQGHAETWRQASNEILRVMCEETAKIVVRHYCQMHLRGKYVHAHKGRGKRQHRQPNTYEWLRKHPNYLPKLTMKYMEIIHDGQSR